MLSTSLENRVQAKVMKHLIERMWPEVLDVPIFSGSKFFDIRHGVSVAPSEDIVAAVKAEEATSTKRAALCKRLIRAPEYGP
jgi:hypothetical protein